MYSRNLWVGQGIDRESVDRLFYVVSVVCSLSPGLLFWPCRSRLKVFDSLLCILLIVSRFSLGMLIILSGTVVKLT